jgi:hypothetical protein
MTVLRSNPELADERMVKNKLSHGMVSEMTALKTENAPSVNN